MAGSKADGIAEGYGRRGLLVAWQMKQVEGSRKKEKKQTFQDHTSSDHLLQLGFTSQVTFRYEIISRLIHDDYHNPVMQSSTKNLTYEHLRLLWKIQI